MVQNQSNTSKTSKQEIIERTKKAFAPPTQKQLRQQAEARAKGGLTSRGIAKFEKKTEQEKKQAQTVYGTN